MAFSQAQYQAAIDKINQSLTDVTNRMGQVIPAAQAGVNHDYIPQFVKDAVMKIAQETVSIAQQILTKIKDLLVGAAAPVMFFVDAYEWESVRGLASGVAGELVASVMPSTQHWKGDAEGSYTKMMPTQATAASRIGTISDSTAMSLGICAAAGLAFYVALGVIVAQFIVAMVAVIAAFGSVAFSWAGVALAFGEAAVTPAMITAAVVTLVAALGVQAQQMTTLHGQAIDNTAFPGGRWPDPNTGSFNHAS